MVDYVQVGPFTEDGAPAISPAFLNALEDALLAMDQVENTADLDKPVSDAAVAAVVTDTLSLAALKLQFYDQDEITNLLTSTASIAHGHVAADISDFNDAILDLGYRKIDTYNSALAETPGDVSPYTLWLDIAEVPITVSVDFVTGNQDSTNASSWVFTPEFALNTFPDADYFVAFVFCGDSTGTAGTPCDDPDTLTGGGMTWAAQGSPQPQPNGLWIGQVFKTTAGTPAAGNLTVGATGGTEGCILLVAAVTNLTAGGVFKSAPATSFTTPTLTLSGTTGNQVVLCAVESNSGSQTFDTDPGTPLQGAGAPDVTMSSPSGKARMTLVDPAANSIGWVKSGSAQYITMGIVLGDA